MKIKSLLLGSIAAAGLSTGAYAADLSVLTSLDTCDNLGISGLKFSSGTNCMTVTGEVAYEFSWGDYNGKAITIGTTAGKDTGDGTYVVMDNDQWTVSPGGTLGIANAGGGIAAVAFANPAAVLAAVAANSTVGIGSTMGGGTVALDPTGAVYWDSNGDGLRGATEGTYIDLDGDGNKDANEPTLTLGAAGIADLTTDATDTYDWDSKVDAFIQFVATSDTDFGQAKATIKIKYDDDIDVNNERATAVTSDKLIIDQAYVSVGDSTIITAGKKGTIFEAGHDTSYGWMKLFNEEKVDGGVRSRIQERYDDGGHVIQVISDLGNGVTIKGGLEELNQVGGAPAFSTASSGAFVGVLDYAGDVVQGHVSVVTGGFLDGVVSDWAVHAGLTATVDMFKFTGAIAADDNGFWNGLAAASATFDMFTLTGAVEFVDLSAAAGNEQFGFGMTAEAAVTDTIAVNAGVRYFDSNTTTAANETWQAALQLVADVTETLKLTGEVGVYITSMPVADVTYGSVELAWAPSDEFSSSVKGEMNSAGGYKVTYKAKKTFQ